MGMLDRYRAYLQILAELHMAEGIKSKVSASDIVQLTLIEAWKSADRIEGWSVPQQLAWLRKTLARTLGKVARDLHRRKRDVARERSLEDSLDRSSRILIETFAVRDPSPSERAERRETLLEVAEGLTRLPPAQRRALLFYYIDGRSLEEIGAALERTPVAVGGLIRRGLKGLRDHLP